RAWSSTSSPTSGPRSSACPASSSSSSLRSSRCRSAPPPGPPPLTPLLFLLPGHQERARGAVLHHPRVPPVEGGEQQRPRPALQGVEGGGRRCSRFVGR